MGFRNGITLVCLMHSVSNLVDGVLEENSSVVLVVG